MKTGMSGPQEIEYEVFRPFGPFIGDFTVPQSIVDELNAFTEAAVKDSALVRKLNHGDYLVGEVSQEIMVPEDILMGPFGKYLMDVSAAYIGVATGKKVTRFKMIGCWIVRSFAGDYNPPHNHRGHISGAGYLKVPSQIGTPEGSRKKGRSAGSINFLHGSDQFLSAGHLQMAPREGHMFLFPHYLNHSVNPFSGKGERRSFSFNAYVDDDIFNIYSAKVGQ